MGLFSQHCIVVCFPISEAVKSASVTHQAQLPFLCNTTLMALVVHSTFKLGSAVMEQVN